MPSSRGITPPRTEQVSVRKKSLKTLRWLTILKFGNYKKCHWQSKRLRFRRTVCLQELLVALGSGEYDVDPDAHRLRAGRHQIQRPVGGLDAERQRRVGTADGRLSVVDVDVLDRPEADGAARRRAGLQLVGVVVEASPRPVEDEPSPVPFPQLAAHLGQVAVAGARRHLDVSALGQVVAGRFDELAQIELGLADRKITSQRTSRRCRQLYNVVDNQSINQSIYFINGKLVSRNTG